MQFIPRDSLTGLITGSSPCDVVYWGFRSFHRLTGLAHLEIGLAKFAVGVVSALSSTLRAHNVGQ